MAGHSHWKQIKTHKGIADKKRGTVFSKLLAAIAVAARRESNPQFNAPLRSAILKAKESQVPQENIERAISKAGNQDQVFDEMVIEAYGPGGSALIIEAISDNKNRTINEIKLIFKDFETKLAEPGGVRWAFKTPINEISFWQPVFEQKLNALDLEKLQHLITTLKDHADIHEVFTNAK